MRYDVRIFGVLYAQFARRDDAIFYAESLTAPDRFIEVVDIATGFIIWKWLY